MTEQHTVIPEILGATDDAVANLITKMQEMGFDQAPAMFEGVVRKIALDGVIGVSSGAVFGVLCCIFMWALFRGCSYECDEQDKRDGSPYIVVGGVGGGISFVLLLVMVFAEGTLIKFFDPEAWFYAHLFNKLL